MAAMSPDAIEPVELGGYRTFLRTNSSLEGLSAEQGQRPAGRGPSPASASTTEKPLPQTPDQDEFPGFHREYSRRSSSDEAVRPSPRLDIVSPAMHSQVTREDRVNLDNPLQLFRTLDGPDGLNTAIKTFADRHGLQEKYQPLLRAANYERDKYEALDDENLRFTEEEKRELEDSDKTPFWKQTSSLRAAVLVVSTLSGICQGFNQSVLNGTGPDIAKYYGLHVFADDKDQNNSDLFVYGAMSACVPLAAGILTLFIADPIQNHWLGRRGAIALSAAISIAATIGAACSQNITQLIGCRVVIGASLGAKASIISPFLAELSPVHLRGALLSTWQITDAFGILLGFIAWKSIQSSGLGDDSHVETRWRLLTLTPLIPTIPLLLVAYMVPESYIFLMKTRNYRKAARSACQYRRTDIQGLRDLAASHFQMEAEGALMEKRKEATKQRKQAPTRKKTLPMSRYNTFDETRPLEERLREGPPGVCRDVGDGGECPHHYHMKEVHFFKRLWQVFADARCRRALISCGMAMLTQSVCGINAFAFYSSSLLDAGLSSSASANLSISFGIVNFCFGLLAPFLSDRLGRTTLLLGGLPFMSLFMFMLAGLIAPSNPARDATILVFTLCFTAVYSFTLGPAAFSLSAESFSSSVRESGMAVAVSINMVSLGIQLLVYPFVTSPIHYTGSLAIFGGISVLAFVGCFLFCIDTKDRTLDELQYSFDLPSRLHFRYRLFYVLPNAFRHFASPSTWGSIFRKLCQCGVRQERRRDEENSDIDSMVDSWRLAPFHLWARMQNRPK